MHVSLDGYTTGPKGEMDFITFDEDLQAYVQDLFTDVDTVIFGKNTFLMMEQYWPSVLKNPAAFSRFDQQYATWINDASKLVVSASLEKSEWNNTTILSEADDLRRFKLQHGNTMAIIGSPSLVHSCIELDLIDQFWINLNPVALGGGIPLFYNLESRLELDLLETVSFRSGVVGLQYRRI
jgi:dihydrofolate reductase